jgi:hypothetical protein
MALHTAPTSITRTGVKKRTFTCCCGGGSSIGALLGGDGDGTADEIWRAAGVEQGDGNRRDLASTAHRWRAVSVLSVTSVSFKNHASWIVI